MSQLIISDAEWESFSKDFSKEFLKFYTENKRLTVYKIFPFVHNNQTTLWSVLGCAQASHLDPLKLINNISHKFEGSTVLLIPIKIHKRGVWYYSYRYLGAR